MSLRQTIRASITQFNDTTLFDSGIAFFNALGYNTSRQQRLGKGTFEEFQQAFVSSSDPFDAAKALADQWRGVELLFQLTQAEIDNQAFVFDTGLVDRTFIEAYLFWAIDLEARTDGKGIAKPYSRTELSQITRELNRLFPMPCMVLFRHDGLLTLSLIDRRLHKRDDSRDVLSKKVTLVKDISIQKPHSGHLAILEDLSFGELLREHRFDSFVALHRAWQKTLDTSLLNKRFYEELFTWYLWAKSHPNLWFPKPEAEQLDDDAHRSVSVIRLLTRLIFVWFIKEKGLVPDELFNWRSLDKLLRDFKPASDQASDYYRAILQNLFFATLNTAMAKDTDADEEKRQFVDPARKGNKGYADAYGDQTKYRYANCFRDPQDALKIFESVPFLNGGLFECLDYAANKETGEVERRYDGFSMTERKQARVPNQLFFGEYEMTDEVRAEMAGKPRKDAKLKGLVDILNGYKFTLTENTPLEEEVALDPELLGKVFENLLASYNPETQVTARKQTGSFYTPREIVNYMVDESLKAYLLQKLTAPVAVAQTEFGKQQTQLFGNEVKRGQLDMLQSVATTPTMAEKAAQSLLETLFDDTREMTFSADDAIRQSLITALSEAKILDPACGSGAYPMGILHRMVNLLTKLDPNNQAWKEAQLRKAERDRHAAEQFEDFELREKAVQSAERRMAYIRESFDNSRHELDYTRKLFLIENCIYGVDIQQIAVQIAKLRFFISLVADQRVDDARPNRNVLSMPNLETRFVAANSLVALEKPAQLNVFGDSAEVKKVEKELHGLRQQIFFVRRYRDKKKLQKAEAAKRRELQQVLEKYGYPKGTAGQIAGWNPFDAMHSAGFFDTVTMFNFMPQEGFDIVIGNPPYVQIQKLDAATKAELDKQKYETYKSTGDLYQLFYEAGLNALVKGGHLCYITSNKRMRTDYGRVTRSYFATKFNTKEVIDFGMAQLFESATTYTNILLIAKEQPNANFSICRIGDDLTHQTPLAKYIATHQIQIENPGEESWIAYDKSEYALIQKIVSKGKPLKDWDIKINRGIVTGYNKAFIIDTPTRDRLVAEDPKSDEIIKPVLRGEDIKAYVPAWAEEWLIGTFPALHLDINEFPAIKNYLSYIQERLEPKPRGYTKKWKGRKSGSYKWFETQDSISYHEDFSKPKIIYPNMTKYLPFVYDKGSFFTNEKCFIITGEILEYLTAFFNSRFSNLLSETISRNYWAIRGS